MIKLDAAQLSMLGYYCTNSGKKREQKEMVKKIKSPNCFKRNKEENEAKGHLWL